MGVKISEIILRSVASEKRRYNRRKSGEAVTDKLYDI